MRYACPSCNRVFYLETKTVSPCPACGTTLSAEGDEEGAVAPAAEAPGTPAVDAGASWLLGGSEAEAATEATAVPVFPPSPAGLPPAPHAAPNVQTWISPPAQYPAPTQPAADVGFGDPEMIGDGFGAEPQPSDPMSSAAALDALNAAARPSGPVTSSMPSAPRSSRMPAARGPSGSHVFLITSGAVLVTVAIAVGVVMLLPKLRPTWLPTIQRGGRDLPVRNQEEMDALRTRLGEAESKLAEEQRKASDASKARLDLELKLEETNLEAGALKGRLERLSISLGFVLEAQALLERHSDLDGALSLVDAALKRDPTMLAAWRLKGRVLAASGLEAKPALEAFERTDKAARDAGGAGDAEALVLAGEVCLTDLGDRDRALGYYQRAAGLETESPFRLAADARASQLQNRTDRAVAKANELARAEPSLPLAPLVAGEVILGQALRETAAAERGALLEKADLYLAKALKLDPNSARGCLMRGRLLLEQSKLAGGFGFAMARLGPQSRAERLLTTAKQLKPRIPGVHLALAELGLTGGALRRPAEALQSATEAVRLTGRKNAPALALLAQAYAATGNPAKAVGAIKEAMTIEPKNQQYMDLHRLYKDETQSLSQ